MELNRNQKIEDYLLDRLAPEDAEAFKKVIAADPALAQEVRNQQATIDQAEHLGAIKMKKRLEGIGEKFHQQRAGQSRRRTLRWSIAAAASIALLILASQLLWNNNASTDQLYANYYQAYELPFNSRTIENPDEKIIEAGSYYRKGEFGKAIPVLSALLVSNPDDSRLRMALGISQLEEDNTAAAITTFASLIATQDTLYNDQAHWYTALALLKQDKIAACKKELQWLVDRPSAFQRAQAIELLKDLE